MLVFPCFQCGHAIRVIEVGTDTEHMIGAKSEKWPDKFQCPICDGSVTAVLEMDLTPFMQRSFQIHDLEPLEAYLAFDGMGMPEEASSNPGSVEEALKSGVVKVRCEPALGTTRTVITSIECSNGKTLYLGASPLGAVVYRTKNKHSYVHNAVAKEQ